MQRILCGVLLISLCGCSVRPPQQVMTAAETTKEEAESIAVVHRRVSAYNTHDIETFLATYAEDVRIHVYPDRLLGQGRDRMRRIFGPQFARGDGSILVVSQYAIDNKVISTEQVTISGVEEKNIAIYTVRDGLISDVRLIEPGER